MDQLKANSIQVSYFCHVLKHPGKVLLENTRKSEMPGGPGFD